MKRQLTVVLFLLYACPGFSQTQHADSAFSGVTASLDSINSFFTSADSLEIFEMIDSLLKADPNLFDDLDKSQLAIRLGYNSNITADNRTFNIEQFGLAPGLSYYHKSGAYADVSSYWSNEFNPSFYLTVTSAGYLHTFTKHYSILAEYSHYFYNLNSDSTVAAPYTNNIGISNYFEFKPFVFRLDYFLYFGDRTAHRIMPTVGLNLMKRNWLGFDRIMFFPAFVVIFGSEQVIEYGVYPNAYLRQMYNLRYNKNLALYYEEQHTEFGVMNYGFTAPVTFSKKNWTFLISYTYNIPKSLPSETLTLENSGYLSFSITRYFNL